MKRIFNLLYLLLLCNVVAMAQQNTLTIPDVSVPQGGTISLPIQMDNSADIVAMQFTLTMPEGITLDANSCAMTDRADGHSVRMKNIGGRSYLAMVYSDQNKPIQARTGDVITVKITADRSLELGTVLPMTVTDVVLSNRDRKNIVTGYSAGKITIGSLPDFEVSAVNASATNITPGQDLQVEWTVKNIGQLPTTAGWKEQIYLEDNDGNSKLLTTAYNDDIISAGSVVSRSVTIQVPEILGLDGEARIRVQLTPYSDSGEPSWLRANNAATSAATLNISKFLTLTPALSNIAEKNQQIRYYLTRSGKTTQEETFPLVATTDSRVVLPDNVIISQGQPGVFFYAEITANNQLDNDSIVNIAISGNGYEEVKAKMVIEDDRMPALTITANAEDVTEGNTIGLTITTQRAPKSDLAVNLSCDLPARFNIPSNIVIQAGETKVDLVVEAIDDENMDIEQVVVFTASAEKHEPGSLHTTLLDNDVPNLQLTLNPTEVSEDAGPESVEVILRRTDNIDKKITVKFSDDSNGNIHYALPSVEMASGMQEIKVFLGPIDNNLVDGERTYNISAAVWIASCSCSASNSTSGGVISVPLTVYDNDGPTLSATSSSSIMKEGEEITVTVSRNADLSNPVVVNVSSDHDSALEYPSTVTIPAGEASVSFKVKAISNGVAGDDFKAVLTLQGNGFGRATLNFNVSDQSYPDAQVTGLTLSASEAYAGDAVTATLSLTNVGNYALPAETKVDFYFEKNNTPVATTTLGTTLAVGGSAEVSKEITVPETIGTYNVYAKVNADQAVTETSMSNNMSQYAAIVVLPPYSAAVSTDKEAYNQGETVKISGKISGKDIANKTVEVYLINEGSRQTLTATTDASGNFSVDFTPISGQMGHFAIGACYPSEGKIDEMAGFDIFGLKLSDLWSQCDLTEKEEFKGTIKVTNPCAVPQKKIKVSVNGISENCDFQFSTINELGAGESATLECTIKPNSISTGREYQQLPLTIASKEGATAEHTIYYYVLSAFGKLHSNTEEINTTMTLGAPRDYPIVIRNIGKGETGDISFALPSFVTTATSKTVPSIASGDSTTVVLRFNPTDKMQLNVPITGALGINCANGDGLAINFSITPVSSAKGALKLSLVDEFTFYTAEAPGISGATVTVKKPGTNEVVISGTSDANGIFEAELQEGYYHLSVDADHHDSYNAYILIDPEKTLEQEIFMSYQTVTYSWDVEETEIVDEYAIETIVNFDVRVPKPVIVVALPEEKPEVYDIVPVVLTNKGLISAVNVSLSLQAPKGYYFEFLHNPTLAVLAPQQAETFYARLLPEPTEANAKRMAKAKDDDEKECFYIISKTKYQELCDKYTGDEFVEQLKTYAGDPLCRKKAQNDYTGGGYTWNLNYGGFGGFGGGGGDSWYGKPTPYQPTIWSHNSDSYTIPIEDPKKFCDEKKSSGSGSGSDSGSGSSSGSGSGTSDPFADAISYDGWLANALSEVLKWERAKRGEMPDLDLVLVDEKNNRYQGVAADGASTLLIVPNPATSKLPSEEDENECTLDFGMFPNRSSYGRIEYIDPSDPWKGLIYHAPENFPGGENEQAVTFQVVATMRMDGVHKQESTNIRIVRPPVVMVHGLNSGRGAWAEPMKEDFVNRGMYEEYQIYTADYSDTNCSLFSENYKKPVSAIHTVLQQYKDKKYYAKKVDYIGHSMGGILGRFYVQQSCASEITPKVHKFITINTPHSGSHLGNIVENHPVVQKALDIAHEFDFLGKDEFKSTDAIFDLAVGSDAIDKDLNQNYNFGKFNNIHVPAHAITTVAPYKYVMKKLPKAVLEKLPEYIDEAGDYILEHPLVSFAGGVGGRAGIAFAAERPDVILALIGSLPYILDIVDWYFLDDSFGHLSYSDISKAVKGLYEEFQQMGDCDLIVPFDSETGGMSKSNYTLFDEPESEDVDGLLGAVTDLNHMGSPNYHKVRDKIVELLNADTDNGLFSHQWFKPNNTLRYEKVDWGKVDKIKNYNHGGDDKAWVKRRAKANDANSNIKIIDATIDGDSLRVSLSEICKKQLVVVDFEDYGRNLQADSVFAIEIPSSFSGNIKVKAMVRDQEDNVLSDEVVLNVASSRATPLEISSIGFDIHYPDNYAVTIPAKWDDGSETRIVPESAIFKKGIARYENGMIVPLAAGEDEVTFTYKGLTCTAKIAIYKAESNDEEGDDGEGICSTITLSFKQTAYVTRQAFRGTLKINNGYKDDDLKDFKLNLTITDEDGNVAGSDKFQINPETLEGFEGDLELGAGWTLRAGKDGVATIIFIPTKNAAPTADKKYNFGGSFSYIDPSNGLVVTRQMNPVTLTVSPSPQLDLTYFMQRDVLGDDPMTETIEPSKEAEFSLLINNKGYGDAKRVQFVTKQPEIVENEKNLVIDFEIISSQFNSEEKNLALGGDVETDFGTIPANSTAYAQWWMKSSLLGHFSDYSVNATHVTSYDNPDLSLLNDVTIHELIRSLDLSNGEEKMVGFLANDIKDNNHVPDMLYLSNGEIKDVVSATGSNIVKNSSTEYTLTVAPSATGWNYGNLLDPTYGAAELTGIVRQSDGKVIPLRNFWQTDRTLRDNKDPLYENRIHFADEFKVPSAETYILTFTPLPDLLLEVMAFENIPDESIYIEEPLETVKVIFNKTIDPATFTTDDLSMSCQGKKQDVSLIGISTTDNKTFTLDLTDINKLCGNGFYNLTVQTAEITDDEGYNGREGKSACWVMHNPMLNESTLLYNGNSVAIPVALTLPNKPAEATAVNAMVFTKADLSTQADVFANLAYKKMTDEGSIWTSKNIELVDAQPFFTPYDVEADKVTYTREFKNTNWQALYVPFPVDVFEFAGKADVAYFTNVYMHDSDNDGVGDMAYLQLKNMESGKLEPNEPYLIKPYAVGKMVVEVQNTTLSSTVNNGRIEFAIPTDIYTLTGTYQPTVMYETGRYGLSGGQFKYALTPEAVLSPFRFYLDITSLTGKPTPLMCGIIFDDETTGIRNTNDNSNAELYDLQGRRVKNPTAAGVYVTKGGKRVKK